ncbi:ubiquinol-cytochrome c reductase iron-sulfur subunit [Galenea microaerophila]
MSDKQEISINRLKRRQLLTGAVGVVGATGATMLAVPFVSSWMPSEKAKAAGAPVEIDVSAAQPGQMLTVAWRGKPVWVVNRTPEMLATLSKVEPELRDPNSDESQQPVYCKNKTRSIKPEFLVVVGVCTHLGCAPMYRPNPGAEEVGPNWLGGFFCPCHGSRFDLAGRVYTGVPAPINLEIPPHRYVTDTVIKVGEDPKTVKEGAQA